MGAFAAGEVILVHFPFSDLSQSKLRPAVVVADAGKNDWILCQVTSQAYRDPRAIAISDADMTRGSLRVSSYARPGKLFTAHETLTAGKIGALTPTKFNELREAVIRLIQTGGG